MAQRRFYHQANWLSFKEAREKLGDALSSLVLFRCKRHMVLSPRYLGRINKGVKETLDADLRLYCPKLCGVLVAYNNVTVQHVTGDIQDEAPFIHFDIEADFIVFRPAVGCSLKGVINKVGKDHIGCLVHSCFNASMSKPRSKGGNSHEADQLMPGVELEFEVTGLSNNNRILSLRGCLKPNSLRNLPKSAVIHKDIFNGNLSMDEIEVLSTPKSSKKKKRNKEQSGADNPLQGEVNLSDDLFSDSKPKKKKRKLKETLVNDQEDTLNLPSTSFETDGSHKKKKRKKNVSLDGCSIESILSVSSIMDSGVDISLVGSDTSVNIVKVKKHIKKERDIENYMVKEEKYIKKEREIANNDSDFTIQENSESPRKKSKHKKKSKIKEEVM